jgi:hypothetical protein
MKVNRVVAQFNTPDAPNPAMAPRLTAPAPLRKVGPSANETRN